jgi:hypothetical protein
MLSLAVRKPLAVTACAATAGALAIVAGLTGPAPDPAGASSHAEAPLIATDPRADNTDLYAFVSPERPDTVTIIANYVPLEVPAGGPNFYGFDDSVGYRINVDTNSDSIDDTVYLFRFKTQTRNPNTFLYNVGPITANTDPDWNRPQTYTVTRFGRGGTAVLGRDLPTPPANVGPRSTPDYASLATGAVNALPGGIKVFAGPREDPFFVDLGSIFDLAGLRPFNNLHLIPLVPEPGRDAVARFNVHSIALQLPISTLTRPGHPTVGVYASATRQRVRVLRWDGSTGGTGDQIQVSRLGDPLINEVVIPLGMKDYWNRSDPSRDSQFARFYRSPEVTRLENALYPALDDARTTNRDDLVTLLLTGVPGLNFTGTRKADLLRLNTTIKPTAAAGAGNRLGVLSGDLAGFPNGRRLEDDIVDIELRAFGEGYGTFLNGLLGLPNRSPNNQLGDGVDANDKPALSAFPYVALPNQGYQVP